MSTEQTQYTVAECKARGACSDRLTWAEEQFGEQPFTMLDVLNRDGHLPEDAEWLLAEFHAPLWADYEAKRDALLADYRAKRGALLADYRAKDDALWADYEAKHAPLWADYEAKRDALLRRIAKGILKSKAVTA